MKCSYIKVVQNYQIKYQLQMSITKRKTDYYLEEACDDKNDAKKFRTIYYVKNFENDIAIPEKIVRTREPVPMRPSKLSQNPRYFLKSWNNNIHDIELPTTPENYSNLSRPPPIRRQAGCIKNMCDFIEELTL